MIRRPPRSTLFPTRRSSDLRGRGAGADEPHPPADRRAPRPGAAHGGDPHHLQRDRQDRKSTRLNSSHVRISYAVFCLKKKKKKKQTKHKKSIDLRTCPNSIT